MLIDSLRNRRHEAHHLVCSSEKDVSCEVTWKAADDTELGRGDITYEALDDVDAGLDMCKEDQMDHADRPSDAVSYACNCST
jgi:hypothetical protein